LRQDLSRGGDIALVLLGEVPAIGPCFKKSEEAKLKAHFLLTTIDGLISRAQAYPYKVMFRRQIDGCYTLVIKSDVAAVNVLSGIDELLLRRFQKVFRSLFILTCFYEVDGRLECLAVTEGLGAVLYSYYDSNFFQSK
jgi:hypothetical protein